MSAGWADLDGTMVVRLSDESGVVWTGELEEFLADNEVEDRDEITNTLLIHGFFNGGGGASPEWRLAIELNYVLGAAGWWSRVWRSARSAWRCARIAGRRGGSRS